MTTGKYTPCALTGEQQKKWDDTRVALLWHCPAFTHIFYTMLDTMGQKTVALFTKDVPIAATDGSCIMFNPETYFQMNLQERVFVASHEIMHCILNHCVLMHGFHNRGKVSYADGTHLPYVHEVMNVAMDYVINDLLIEGKVGQFPKIGLHDPNIAKGTDSVVDAYRKVLKVQKGGGAGKGQGPGGFDVHLDPGSGKGQDPTTASQARSQSEWQTAIAAAANAARAQGKLPANLDRLLGEVLDPKVDWQDKIAALFARKIGSGSFDWRRADRRLIVRDIYAPGRSGFGAGTVIVAVDTSGSIGPKELDMFFAEMAGILEDVKPKRLMIAWCDAKLHRVDEVEEPGDLNVVRHKGAPGGGGTSFIPVFDWIEKDGLEPDALVYLTDGMGSFPAKAPPYTVIWGSIYDSPYPFGDVVDIPKQAA